MAPQLFDVYHALQVWRNGKLLVIGEYAELDAATIRLISYVALPTDVFTFRVN